MHLYAFVDAACSLVDIIGAAGVDSCAVDMELVAAAL